MGMPNVGLLLSTTAQQLPGFGRKCGVWVSPWVADAAYILDTSAINEEERRFAGLDVFPADCLLVIVNERTNAKWRDDAAKLPYPVTGPFLAALFINARCEDDPELALKLRW